MNYSKLRAALNQAAGLARQAADAEHLWEHPHRTVGPATHPDEFWRKLFGRKYPRARERFLRPPATEPWAEIDKVKPEAKVRLDHPDPPDGKPRPNEPGGGGPKGPDLNPDDQHLGPHGPGDGPRLPRWPFDGPSRGPGGPRRDGGTQPRQGPVPAESGADPREESPRPDGTPRAVPSPSGGGGPPHGGSGSGGLASSGPARRRYLKRSVPGEHFSGQAVQPACQHCPGGGSRPRGA
jgi:hypothetical protein